MRFPVSWESESVASISDPYEVYCLLFHTYERHLRLSHPHVINCLITNKPFIWIDGDKPVTVPIALNGRPLERLSQFRYSVLGRRDQRRSNTEVRSRITQELTTVTKLNEYPECWINHSQTQSQSPCVLSVMHHKRALSTLHNRIK